ncbi:MAG: DUF2066 domain-containing protein [Magnetospirillum sp. WYHS-4]
MTHRRCFAGLFLVAGLLSFAAAALANPYEVKDVRVDETADTAAKAREKAHAAAETLAFTKLIHRLVLAEDHAKIPPPSRAELAALVSDFGVTEEKASSVRYIGRLVFRFKTEAVRKLLRDKGVGFAETESKPLVVVPLFQGQGPLTLWEAPNPWKAAWQAMPSHDGLVPLVVPLGDLADVATVSVERANKGEAQALMTLAQRYEAAGALVPRAVLRTDARKGVPVVEIAVSRFGPGGLVSSSSISLAAEGREDADTLLRRAASALAVQVQDEWKRINVLRFDAMGITPAMVPVNGLKDWLEVRRRLEGVAVVRQIDVIQMSRDSVRIALHHLGDPQQLVTALKQSDLSLALEGDQWMLRSATAGIPVLGGGGGTAAPRP